MNHLTLYAKLIMFVNFRRKGVHSFINVPGHPVALNSLETVNIDAPYNFIMNIIFKKIIKPSK